MEQKLIKEGWIVVTPTLCTGNTMAWSTEDDHEQAIPIVFATKEEAWKEIAEDMIIYLQQFIDGERDLDDTDFGTEEWAAEYNEFDDGEIVVYDEQGNPIIETTLEKWRAER